MGTGLSKLLKLVLIVVAARLLGIDEYGKLTFAFGFVSLFIIFSDLGFSSIVTREFAAEGRTAKDFSSLFSLKLLLSLGTLLLISAVGFFQESALYKIILLFAVAGLVSGLGTFFYSLFQAKQKMKYQAWSVFLESALVTALGFYILFTNPSANHLAYAYLAGSALAIFAVAIFFHRKIFPLKPTWDPAFWKSFIVMAWPMAGVLLFSTIYFDLSSVMLGTLGTLKDTAIFNAGYRPVSVILIGLNLISVSFFPALSAALKHPREEWESLWNVEFRLLLYLVVPIVAGGILLAPRIIDFLYGTEFIPAVPSLRFALLSAGILVLFIPLKDMLVAAHQQKKAFIVVLISTLFTAGLNLILIPRYGIQGALLSTLGASVVLLFSAWIFMPKWIGFLKTRPAVFKTACIAGLAAAAMAYVVRRPEILQFHLAMIVLIGAATYGFSLFIISQILKNKDVSP